MDLALVPLDTESPAQLERFAAAWSAAWPEDPIAPAELRWEFAMEQRVHRWLVEAGGEGRDPEAPALGIAHVERIRWNPETAPPIAWIGLVEGAGSAAAYEECLRACAHEARAWGFDELRVSVWAREHVLAQLLQARGFEVRETEVFVGLDVASAPQVPAADAARSLPEGIRVTDLAAEPQLARAAWECFVAASADVPGDEPTEPPTFERWQREREAPWVRDDGCFLAVDAAGAVLGFADLEQWELPGDVVWHGYTAVHPDARGRGIAGALKLHTIEWARARGIRELRTENEESNGPMRHINARLGYRPVATRLDWRGPVAALLDG